MSARAPQNTVTKVAASRLRGSDDDCPITSEGSPALHASPLLSTARHALSKRLYSDDDDDDGGASEHGRPPAAVFLAHAAAGPSGQLTPKPQGQAFERATLPASGNSSDVCSEDDGCPCKRCRQCPCMSRPTTPASPQREAAPALPQPMQQLPAHTQGRSTARSYSTPGGSIAAMPASSAAVVVAAAAPATPVSRRQTADPVVEELGSRAKAWWPLGGQKGAAAMSQQADGSVTITRASTGGGARSAAQALVATRAASPARVTAAAKATASGSYPSRIAAAPRVKHPSSARKRPLQQPSSAATGRIVIDTDEDDSDGGSAGGRVQKRGHASPPAASPSATAASSYRSPYSASVGSGAAAAFNESSSGSGGPSQQPLSSVTGAERRRLSQGVGHLSPGFSAAGGGDSSSSDSTPGSYAGSLPTQHSARSMPSSPHSSSAVGGGVRRQLQHHFRTPHSSIVTDFRAAPSPSGSKRQSRTPPPSANRLPQDGEYGRAGRDVGPGRGHMDASCPRVCASVVLL